MFNRQARCEEAARWSGVQIHPEDHLTWRTVNRTLFGLRPEQPIVIVLDEFQYPDRLDKNRLRGATGPDSTSRRDWTRFDIAARLDQIRHRGATGPDSASRRDSQPSSCWASSSTWPMAKAGCARSHPHGVVRSRLATEIDQEEGLRNTSRYRAVLATMSSKTQPGRPAGAGVHHRVCPQ